MLVQVKIVDARLVSLKPEYATPGSAAIDLRACVDSALEVKPGEVLLVSSGLKVYIGDPNYCCLILPRSGLGHKKGLILGNGTGLVDSDYQGVLQMSIWNRSNEAFKIEPLERIAQLLFVPIVRPQFEIVDEFKDTSKRADGGFGSTGS